MNQMIIKYCRHKSDIVVVFETVIMYLSQLSGPSPPRDQHNGDNEVRDNERSSAASAVTFFIILRPPPLDNQYPLVTRHHMMCSHNGHGANYANNPRWVIADNCRHQIFPKIVPTLQRETDVDAVTDSRQM